MERLRRLIHLPNLRKRSLLGEVPGAEVPSVREYRDKPPGHPEDFDRIVKALNGGVSLDAINRSLDALDEEAKGSHKLGVIFRDSMGWKIVTGMAGTTLTIGAAIGIYEVTKKILEARNKRHK